MLICLTLSAPKQKYSYAVAVVCRSQIVADESVVKYRCIKKNAEALNITIIYTGIIQQNIKKRYQINKEKSLWVNDLTLIIKKKNLTHVPKQKTKQKLINSYDANTIPIYKLYMYIRYYIFITTVLNA